MKAVITTKAGSPNVLEIKEINIPKPQKNEVLIRVKAFGLNRAELFTRQGHSPGVTFPIIQGIECVGEVVESTNDKWQKHQQVAAIMGGMGRFINGGYAEYCCVPSSCIIPFKSDLAWPVLGALPEMFQTVAGSLYEALEIKMEEVLLIRGGTSSIGMLACQIAKSEGLMVIATTRNPQKKELLLENGADHVVIDKGNIARSVKELIPDGAHKTLELVGTTTLKDSLHCARHKGIVCMTGILGNSWALQQFEPMGDYLQPLGSHLIWVNQKISTLNYFNASSTK